MLCIILLIMQHILVIKKILNHKKHFSHYNYDYYNYVYDSTNLLKLTFFVF